MHWDVVTAWVARHLYRAVLLSLSSADIQGAGYVCAGLSVEGSLEIGQDGELTSTNPPPGRWMVGSVGPGRFVLYEGTIESADVDEAGLHISMSQGDMSFTLM